MNGRRAFRLYKVKLRTIYVEIYLNILDIVHQILPYIFLKEAMQSNCKIIWAPKVEDYHELDSEVRNVKKHYYTSSRMKVNSKVLLFTKTKCFSFLASVLSTSVD
jgi:hypothetical protein